MAKKKGKTGAFLQGMNMSARMNEVMFLSFVQKVKEEKLYASDGYETFKDFCKEEIKVSYETINRRINDMASIGPEITSTLIDLGFKWRDVRMVDHVLNDDQKSNLKKGVLEIEGKKIQVNEDNADLLKSTIDNIIERAALAHKAEQIAEKKLNGIDKEHKKEVKALQSEIDSLQAMVPQDEEDRAWAEKYIEEVNTIMNKLDLAVRTFAFHKRVFGDPVLQAKIIGLHEEAKKRFKDFEQDFDAYISEDQG
jgi:DNA-binding transcriptional regulator GbsR (MarR family)